MILKITTIIPARSCNPNSSCHVMVKANGRRELRSATFEASIEALDGSHPPEWAGAIQYAKYYKRTRVKMDGDNAL